MANTIAKAFGQDENRLKETHRLGHHSATAQANTWRTFTECRVNKYGKGYVEVERDGVLLHRFEFGPENKEE